MCMRASLYRPTGALMHSPCRGLIVHRPREPKPARAPLTVTVSKEDAVLPVGSVASCFEGTIVVQVLQPALLT